jgi:hypothetical protein
LASIKLLSEHGGGDGYQLKDQWSLDE